MGELDEKRYKRKRWNYLHAHDHNHYEILDEFVGEKHH